jgi:isochorismate hydrolase
MSLKVAGVAASPIEDHRMLYDKHVPIAESALLIIDAQDSFKAAERWSRRSNKEFERNVAQLIQAYREHQLPVIYFLHPIRIPGSRPAARTTS